MHITILSLYGAVSPHLETELELAQLHLDKGDLVTMIFCDAALSFCVINPKNDLSMCRVCQQGRKVGLRLLSTPIKVLPLSQLVAAYAEKLQQAKIPAYFPDYDSLFDFEVDDFKIGASVMSSLNFISEKAKPDVTKNPGMVEAAVRSGLAVHYGFLDYLDQNQCDRCYILNGRLAEVRGAIRACEKRGIEFYTHERGRDLNSYQVVKNSLPHDREYVKRAIAQSVQEAVPEDKKFSLADQFYQERKRGIIPFWHSYLKKQKKGVLPPQWLNSSHRVAVFTSTEAEMAALPEFNTNPLYPNQEEGLVRLIREMSARRFDGILAIRTHPNSKEPFDLESRLRDVGHDFILLIAPESELDSYALLDTCHKAVTFGSTIGIEAAYWNKPSVLLGPSIYEHLGGTYNPASHEEAVEMLLSPLPPKGREAAINYGYYQKTHGINFVYAHATEVYKATFKGKPLNVHGVAFYLYRIGWILHDFLSGEYGRRGRRFLASGLFVARQ
jgi:hypothetical protein